VPAIERDVAAASAADIAGDLAGDLAAALDPVRLARRAGIEPDPWQARALRSGARRQILNCSRQSGKSTVTAVKALHKALYGPRSLTLLLSPTLRQSGELFKKVIGLYGDLGRPVPPESETALTLTLENGSRIVRLPGREGTVRGYSVGGTCSRSTRAPGCPRCAVPVVDAPDACGSAAAT
jgi:hypothetical protein